MNKYIERFQNNEDRGSIFLGMILDDAERIKDKLTVLDIGCGKGFDGNINFQNKISKTAQRFIGIEPDPAIKIASHFTETHRCLFENAPIPNNSVHIAYSFMVLEHIKKPKQFFRRIYEVLVQGGVFWGFTIDSRHIFAKLSLCFEQLKIKNIYLQIFTKVKSIDIYDNYPTYYRANSPEDIESNGAGFSKVEFFTFHRVGVLNYYIPRLLQPVFALHDRQIIKRQKPGYMLVCRMLK